MSWFMEISEKAENILNSIDKNAAIALSKQKSTKTTNQNDTFHSPLPENSAIISLEEHFAPETKPNKDVFLSFTDETPASKIEKAEPSISYQRPIPPKVNDKSNDQFQTEILQNEIHSLNNEISLLLNRAKIAEQKSISLAEKLATVERKNLQLEDQLSKLNVNGNTERNEDTSKSSVELEPSETNKKTSKSEWHEHYESQIQELLQDKTNLEETVKSKDDEIIMLKSRLNQQSFSFSSDDLSSRLRAMTITLVQKQSSLERVTLEKTSLEAKYDQLQKKYEEVVHMLHQRLNANDTDDVKAQIPVLKTEKGLRHRIRNAYSSFNPTSLNIELLLKKSSLVKTFVWIYLILMHCLVFLLLNSHMPDTTSNL